MNRPKGWTRNEQGCKGCHREKGVFREFERVKVERCDCSFEKRGVKVHMSRICTRRECQTKSKVKR
jgi:ribosomal protein S14